jgi:hypothetical protein
LVMSRMPWATYLWPGLPQLCRDGTWSSLALAALFAGLLNLAVAASLVWSELLTPGVRNLVWAATLAIWGGSALFSSGADRRHPLPQDSALPQDTFPEAVDHYLKGNWFEAERVLVGLLRRDPRDVDAALMLATLLRHTGRLEEAATHLDRLERIEKSAKWEREILREREHLRELVAARGGQTAQQEPAETEGQVTAEKAA